MEAGFCGYLYAAAAGFAQEGNRLDGGEVDDVEGEVGGEVCEGEDFFNGVGLEGGRSGG